MLRNYNCHQHKCEYNRKYDNFTSEKIKYVYFKRNLSVTINIIFFMLCILAALKIINFGVCPQITRNSEEECASFCTFDYNPVCAVDSEGLRTFANECVMNNYNCINRKCNDINLYQYFQLIALLYNIFYFSSEKDQRW